MKITENFTLEELTVTSTGILNEPNPEQIANLRLLAENILQPLRNIYASPIHVNSGFRSKAVNIAVHGSPTSSHCNGEAADLDCADNVAIFEIIRNEPLPFDQLIWEAGNDMSPDWIHVSYRNGHNRNQVLRMINGKYIPF